MRSWHQALARCEAQGEPYVLVTVLATSGSAPRDGGTKMLVTSAGSYDTVGGGQLEFLVQQHARELLAERQQQPVIQHFPLAAAAEQCCGGSVTVLLEPLGTASRTLWLFGAGHVGQRVAQLVKELPFRLRWIDDRPEACTAEAGLEVINDPLTVVKEIASEDAVVIVTHDHDLDYRLVHSLLTSSDCQQIGLIGSATKAERFRARLEREGLADAARQRLRCPIGLPKGPHKQPMAVAIAIVAELLADDRGRSTNAPLTWHQVKLALLGDSSTVPANGAALGADRRDNGKQQHD